MEFWDKVTSETLCFVCESKVTLIPVVPALVISVFLISTYALFKFKFSAPVLSGTSRALLRMATLIKIRQNTITILVKIIWFTN